MNYTQKTRSVLQPVDLFDDRKYILSELEKAEKEWEFMTLEEAYKSSMQHLDQLAKQYERV